MSDILIIETAPRSKSPIDAHKRLAEIMQRVLGADLIYSWEPVPDKVRAKRYEHIIVVYATIYFDVESIMPVLEKNEQAKLYWCTNEYNLTINSSVYKLFRERGYEVIANFVESGYKNKHHRAFHHVNLNALFARKPNPYQPVHKQHGGIYYGTFRPDRSKYFREYLQREITISTSPKNMKKYRDVGCTGRFVGKVSWLYGRETLNRFRYSLYIEDVFTHSHYNTLANRFYEALFCNSVLLFDKNCIGTIEKAGLDVYDCNIIDGYADLKRFLASDNYEASLKRQRDNLAAWALSERVAAVDHLKSIFKG